MRFLIQNFEINLEEFEDTKRYIKQFCYENGIVYDETRPFLENLTEALQCGFGIQIGFQDEDVEEYSEE